MKRLHKNFCLIGLILLILTGCEREPVVYDVSTDIINYTFTTNGCHININYNSPVKLGDKVLLRASSDSTCISTIDVLFDTDTIAKLSQNQLPWSTDYVLNNTTIGDHNFIFHITDAYTTITNTHTITIVE